jgi:hypothetical protein
METYCRNRYSQRASNGVRKGLVAVRRLKGLDDSDRQKFHDSYATILGRNKYSQALREYVYERYRDGNYYSDCSSSGCYTYKHIGVKCPDLNTAGIYESSTFETVPVLIRSGQITNPEVLKVGDALLFAGNNPSRPRQIGHVEWVYAMPGSAPAPPPQGRTLRRGDIGEDVKEMQEMLITAGYSCGPDGADGDFGKLTEVAVRAFQRDHDLMIDGIYGPETRRELEQTVKHIAHVRPDVPRANVRSGAGVSYPVLGSLSAGDAVELTGIELKDTSSGWSWVQIRFDLTNGWIAKHLLII